MEYINGVSELYIRKFVRKLEQYNKPLPLPEYFRNLIGEKKHVKIAELGAGPINTLGNQWPGVDVEIIASDILWPEYKKLWEKEMDFPITPIETQNMKTLTYPDDYFDIVHCRNAVDHTPDAYKAIEEMKRVCKPGGWVYMAHAPGQKTRFKGHHYWDFETIHIPDFNVRQEKDMIIATWQKI